MTKEKAFSLMTESIRNLNDELILVHPVTNKPSVIIEVIQINNDDLTVQDREGKRYPLDEVYEHDPDDFVPDDGV